LDSQKANKNTKKNFSFRSRQNEIATKSTGYLDKSGGMVALPLATLIKTIHCPFFVKKKYIYKKANTRKEKSKKISI